MWGEILLLLFFPNIYLLRLCRGGKQLRAAALGLHKEHQFSFEANQSFPRVSSRRRDGQQPDDDLNSSAPLIKTKPFRMDRIRG